MANTSSLTVDNLSLHAITVPVPCSMMTIRETASDNSPVAYDITAPGSSNTAFRKFPGEATVFNSRPHGYFQGGDIVGYIQPTAGTVTFSVICE